MPKQRQDWEQAPPGWDWPPKDPQPAMSVSHFAELTNRNPELVRRWIREGRLPTVGQLVRYPADPKRGARPGEQLIPYSALVDFRAKRRGVRHDRKGRLVRSTP
jgi:hypothetical protein